MADPRADELEMRLGAIEFMLCRLYSVILKAGGKPDAEINAGLDQIAREAGSQKFPGLDSAQSDHYSDEHARAVARLTGAIKVLVEKLPAIPTSEKSRPRRARS